MKIDVPRPLPHPLDGVSPRYACTSLSISPNGNRIARCSQRRVHDFNPGLQAVHMHNPFEVEQCFVAPYMPVHVHYVNDNTGSVTALLHG